MPSWFVLVPSAALGIYCAKELWIDNLQLPFKKRHPVAFGLLLVIGGFAAVSLLWWWAPLAALDAGRARTGHRWTVGGEYRNGTGMFFLAFLIYTAILEAMLFICGRGYLQRRRSLGVIWLFAFVGIKIATFGLFWAIGFPASLWPHIAGTSFWSYAPIGLYAVGSGFVVREVLNGT